MFKQRFFTGLLLACMILAAIFYLPAMIFDLIALLVFLIGVDEWARLTSGYSPVIRMVTVIIVALVALFTLKLPASDHLTQIMVSIGTGWWIFIALALLSVGSVEAVKKVKGFRLMAQIAVLPALIPAWLAIIWLQRYDAWLLVFMILLVAVGDSVAYMTGKRFGRRKLASWLSPGKTWEGLMGELIMSALVAVLGGWYFVAGSSWLHVGFVILCLFTVSASVFGDLFESLLKRLAGFKDSGHILPGHGGLLDRMDSHLAAAPVFLMGWLCLRGSGL